MATPIVFTSQQNIVGSSSSSAFLLDGRYVAAHVEHPQGGAVTLHVQRYDAAGNPIGTEFVSNAGIDLLSEVTIAPVAGGYIVGYIDTFNYSASLVVQRFTADGTFLGTTKPAQYGGISVGITGQSIAGLPDGGFVSSWTGNVDQTSLVYAAEFSANGALVGSVHTLGTPGNSASSPQIDVFLDGHYVINWTSPSGPAQSTYTEAGTPIPPYDTDHVYTSAPTYTLPIGLHDVTLTGSTAQSITGNAEDNVIVSNDYASTLNGAGGNDRLVAGHGAVALTGGPGSDILAFPYLPWNAGHVTDFALGTDKVDLSALFAASGYSGSDPVADGYLQFQSDGAGGTRLLYDPDGQATGNLWPFLITTLDHVSQSGLTAAALLTGSGGGGGGGGGGTGQTLTANDTAGQVLTGGSGEDTFYAGHNSVIMTGDGGVDTYIFQYLPWNAGHITDFSVGNDKINLSALFTASGYAGSDPVADGYLQFLSDGAGATQVLYDSDGPGGGNPWKTLITTFDHVSPSGLTAATVLTSGTGGGGGGGGTGQIFTANDTAGQVLTGGSDNDTFFAGHNSVVMTGDGGVDKFVFQYLPWNAGYITDFTSGTDELDLHALFAASGYSGTNAIADGYLRFQSDGSAGTQVMFDPDGPDNGNPWPFLITTLDHVQPTGIHPSDWLM